MVLPKEIEKLFYTSDPQQMILVMDALESVTNGMENAALLEDAGRIPLDSPARPFVDLVFAIQSFYVNDPEGVEKYLQAIPPNSLPARLKPLLRYLCFPSASLPARGIDREIVRAIQQRKGELESTLEEAEKYLSSGQEEPFSDSIGFLIREIYIRYPEWAKKLALWALDCLNQKGWDGSLFKDHLRLIFGEIEAVRLQAVFAIRRNLPGSGERWSVYLLKVLCSGVKEEAEVEAAILVGLYAQRNEKQLQAQEEIIHLLQKEYPFLAQKYEDIFNNLSNIPAAHSNKKTEGKHPSGKNRPIQLELFSQ
ncbi:MAG: hypothetical protein KA771_01720 [Spirochaetales bacterium]|nr:hypothetical protein [Spirochaetales bacterium]